jgi:hypothetical protein
VYVTAGVHTLTVVQDSAHSRTAWNVAIATTNQTVDTLPYLRRGGTLGGPNNAFTQEWLPLRFNQNRPVNMRVATYGAPGNALQVTLYNGNSAVYTATTIYSGEIFWATSDVLSGANRLRIAATGPNTSTVEYKIELLGIPTVPTSWSGIAQANGLNSTAQVFAPVAGVYDLSLVTTEGAGRLSISPTTLFDTDSAQAANVITTTQRVSLNAGMYNITFQQNSEARTVWQINVALNRTSGALSVTSALPLGVPVGQVSTVTLQGTGFTSVSQVELVSSGNSVTAITDFSITSDTALTFTVPASLPRGLYSIRVRSSGGSTVTYARKLTVGSRTFIPFVVR